MLKDKKILLGITGGIAAYKCAELVRLLTQLGALVRVVLTRAAEKFVAPLSLQTLSGHTVYHALSESEETIAHIDLARWADVILIAPASANFIAKLSHGFADDLLSTICVATTSPIVIAPAMNKYMFENKITQNNLKKLIGFNIEIWGPDIGLQACGETGPGRMIEPEMIVENLSHYFSPKLLHNKKLLITAGPTQEPLDPVRYLTNYSSGKMGYAIAEAANLLGAEVILISGPTHLSASPKIQKVEVLTADEMHVAVFDHISHCDIFISAAAVCDYRPENTTIHKIKKNSNTLSIALTPNKDILKNIADLSSKPITIGFAAETENLLENAYQKLIDKKLDMIIANEVGKNKGFNSEDNKVSLITHHKTYHLEKASKKVIARQIIDFISANWP